MSTADLPPEVGRTLAQEFFDFLKTFGIIGLAIAFVIGQAASRLVTALVNDIIDPIIGYFLPAGSLDTLTFKVTNLAGAFYHIIPGTLHNLFRLSIKLIDIASFPRLNRQWAGCPVRSTYTEFLVPQSHSSEDNIRLSYKGSNHC